MNEQGIRFRLGIFVLTSLILLAVLIVLFGGVPTFFRASNRYEIIFDNAAGVGSGTPVKRSGVKIGEVEKLTLDNDTGKVRVFIRIDDKYQVRKADDPTLVQGFLGSDSSIEFITAEAEPGQQLDLTPVPPGSTLDGVVRSDANSVVQEAGKLVSPAEKVLNDIRKTLNRFEKMTPLVEETLREYRDLAKAARTAIPDFQSAGKEIESLAKAVNETIPDLRKTNTEILELTKSVRDSIPNLLKTNDEILALAKDVRKIMPELKQTNDSLQVTIKNWGRVGERAEIFLATNEEKLSKTIAEIEKTVTRVAEVFNDENQKNINAIIRNTREGSRYLDSIAKNADTLLSDGQKTLKKVDSSLDTIDRVLNSLDKTLRPLGERGERIIVNLDEATATLNATLGDVRDLLRMVSQGRGTVQKLLTDPSLYNQLDQSACALNKILPRIDRILRDVEVFADRIARHPETLGVRGAIQPSNGLKTLPTPMVPNWRSGGHLP